MDRRNQVDHQRSDQMDHRRDDNDELERMPLYRRFGVERVRQSQLNDELNMLIADTPIYIGQMKQII